MNLDTLLTQYIAEYRTKKSTILDYRRMLKALAVALRHAPTVADLKNDSLEALARFYHDKGAKPSSVNMMIDRLAALWNYAHDMRLCQWPAPSPKPRFNPKATTAVAFPEKMHRGRKRGTRRPGSLRRPSPTKTDRTLWSYFTLHYARQGLLGKSPNTFPLYGYTF